MFRQCLFMNDHIDVKTYAQKRINLQLTNSSLLYVLDVLQEQSGFSFLFSSEDVRGVEGVTCSGKDKIPPSLPFSATATTDFCFHKSLDFS